MQTPTESPRPQPADPAPGARRRGRARLRAWLREDLPQWLTRTFVEPPSAPVTIEIDASQLILASAGRAGKAARPRIEALRAHPLPPGLVRPSPLQPNVGDPAALAVEIRKLLAGMEAPRAVSVIVPDGAAKVGILELDSLPKSHREAVELVRFRLKKTVPFRIEEAQLDFQLLGGGRADGKVRLLTAVASRPVVEPYQAAVESALGAQAGLITLSTLALAERCLPGLGGPKDGDSLLANLTPHVLTLAVFRAGELLLFRSKVLPVPGESTEEERRAVARREWQATVAYYQEKLAGRGFARAVARMVGWRPEQILEAEDLARLDPVDPSGWAEPAPGMSPPPGNGALYAPALALALKGAA